MIQTVTMGTESARQARTTSKRRFYSTHYQQSMPELSDKYALFLEIARGHAHGRFLDVGCGDGSFGAAVKRELEADVYGVDISDEAVRKARENGIESVSLDIDEDDLPFTNDFFDAVFCGEVIEHVYSPDRLLDEIHRVLRPGGHLFLTTPNMASWFNRISLVLGFQPVFSDISLRHAYGHFWKMEPMGHLRLFVLRSLRMLLEACGFEVLDVKGIGINPRVGFGEAHRVIVSIMNFIFRSPTLSSGILVVAAKR